MQLKYKFIFAILLVIGVIAAVALYIYGTNIAVLDPKGIVAEKQRNLIIITTLLGLVIILPVYIMTFAIAWKYRASNTKAKYTPDWDHHPLAEFIWWAIPCLIILILAVITWQSSHDLDPYKPLASTKKPLKVQVVALPWKWLFIYPEYNIASVNYLHIPVDTPINFEITSDAPMNSFWIPQLGGQVYAMAGMNARLHLMASEAGSYQGSSANISGVGFSGMKFTTDASELNDFDDWIKIAQTSSKDLDVQEYKRLVRPSENNLVTYYNLKNNDLYNKIIMKYMMPNGHQMGLPNDIEPATPDTAGDGYGKHH